MMRWNNLRDPSVGLVVVAVQVVAPAAVVATAVPAVPAVMLSAVAPWLEAMLVFDLWSSQHCLKLRTHQTSYQS